ncbi:hypothetical protein [Fibrella forsythiae]|uniref:Uncharacterized protein n=1 Tax=Fibrella forsythiae TaxID=2817061 RepID=A0ABS3JSX7_9BACT|nr:hypothetical protein [Fibrella forsythiae]MBO0953107.1 hypothetical protein [Fibrella forsythiae]
MTWVAWKGQPRAVRNPASLSCRALSMALARRLFSLARAWAAGVRFWGFPGRAPWATLTASAVLAQPGVFLGLGRDPVIGYVGNHGGQGNSVRI